MRDNINKVSERGARLDSLQDKTDNLAVSAQGFRRGANRVRKQMWWKDMKMRMCLIVGIIILLLIIIVPSGESLRISLRCALSLTPCQSLSPKRRTIKPAQSLLRNKCLHAPITHTHYHHYTYPHINCTESGSCIVTWREAVATKREVFPAILVRVGCHVYGELGAMVLSCLSLHSSGRPALHRNGSTLATVP